MLGDALDRAHAALGLADHDQQAEVEHHVGELVHPGRGGGTSRADHFADHRIDRADVVDRAAPEIDRQLLALGPHVLDPLVRRIAPGQHLAAQQKTVAMLPALHFFRGKLVKIDALRGLVGRPVDLGPVVEFGGFEECRARTVEHDMGVARRRTVRNHRHRLARSVARPVLDLDVEHGREPAQSLRSDPECIDLLVKFETQRLDIA